MSGHRVILGSSTAPGGRKTPVRRAGLKASLLIRCFVLAVSSVSVLGGAQGPPPTVAQPPDEELSVPGEILVKFRDGLTSSQRGEVRNGLGAARRRQFRTGVEHWALGPGVTVREAMGALRGHARIQHVEPNYYYRASLVPNDPRYPDLWNLRNAGQTGGTPGADVHAEQAWNISTGSSSVLVAIIDSGIDHEHPDLAENIYINPGEIPGNEIDDDMNGFVDDVRGWDFRNDDSSAFDDAGHGTHVAGTVGAVGNNGVGVTGVNWRVNLLPLKFLGADGVGTLADAVAAVEYATAAGADIINASWGGPFSETLFDAIAEASELGILFVAASGNGGSNNDLFPVYPASFDVVGVMAVAATDHKDALAAFSNFGVSSVELGAPGVNILSTVPGGGYGRASGTSMAAPHVSGVAALVRSVAPEIGVEDLKQRLMETAEPVSSLIGRTVTGGRLNAFLSIATREAIPPGPVGDLSLSHATSFSLTLNWTATGDDGEEGTATRYDIRYATAPFDDAGFSSATPVPQTPDPLPAGSPERFEVRGLGFDTTYYFALKALDEWGNAGPMSNLASGTTLGPPEIAVTPQTLTFDLVAGEAVTRAVSIENGGVGELLLELSTRRRQVGAASGLRADPGGLPIEFHALPSTPASTGVATYSGDAIPIRDRIGPEDVRISAATGVSVRLLLLHAGVDVSEIRDILSSFPDIAAVDIFNGRDQAPPLSLLLGYDAVIVIANYPWRDPVGIGDVLADYADAGGGVVLTMASYLTHWRVRGRFDAQGYHPLDGTAGPIGSSEMGQFDADHPIMAGVTEAFGAFLAAANLSEGARWVADWAFGQPFIATKRGNIVAVNALVDWTGYWSGDIPLILHNAALWSSRAWLFVAPTSALVPPETSMDVEVTVDTARLVGGSYEAELVIRSNDPDEPEVVVPARLQVTGIADIDLSPGQLDFGPVFLGGSRSLTLTVVNEGTDMLTATLGADHADFTVVPASLSLPAGDGRSVTVTFRPSALGAAQATLSVSSDDPDEPVLVVPLSGAGLVAPDIMVSPDSLQADVFARQTGARTLTLHNTGGNDVAFEIATRSIAPAGSPPSLRAGDLPQMIGSSPSVPSAQVLEQAQPLGFRSAPAGHVLEQAEAVVTPGATVLIVQDLRPWGTTSNEQVLSANGLVYDVIGSALLPTTDLSAYKMVLIPSDQLTSYYSAIAARASQLSAYVASGGVLEFHAAGWGFEDGDASLVTLPGGMRINSSFAFANRVISPLHPVMATVPDPFSANFVNFVSHASFSAIPDGAAILAHDDTGRPNLVEYRIGRGTVIAGGQTFEYGHANNQHPGIILRNMIRYAHGLTTWLSVDPPSGIVPAGGSLDVTVGFDATLLTGGDYDNDILVRSNDPDEPEVVVPVHLRVTGSVEIDLSPTDLDFGPLFVDDTRSLTLTVANEGTGVLEASLGADHADFTVIPVSVSLGAGGRQTVTVTFHPTAVGPVQATLTVSSNDPDEAELLVPLSGTGLVSPDIEVSPAALQADLFTGEAATRSIALLNHGGSDLTLQVLSRHAGQDLEDILANLNESFQDIISEIPDRFDFLEGVTGTFIGDGGSNMYDNGNIISTNLGVGLLYSNNALANSEMLGPGGRYFTRKHPGLFVLAADVQNIDTFIIEGTLGSNVGANVDGAILETQWFGVNYRGFVKRVFNATNPSVNHLIIVPDSPAASHTFLSNSRDDRHVVQGLSATRRLYHLLYAGRFGKYIDDEATLRIMRSFLEAAVTRPRLTLAPRSGVLSAGGRLDVTVGLDATGLIGGDYDADIVVQSNDPDEPEVVVPARLRVTGSADIDLSATQLDFGLLILGGSRSLTLTLANEGTDVLAASLGVDHEYFTVVPTSLSLPVGASQEVTVTFLPEAIGAFQATLSVSSNDPDEGELAVALSATAALAPNIEASTEGLQADVFTGEAAVRSLTLRNSGGSDLTFDVVPIFDPPPPSGVPELEDLLNALNANFKAVTSAIPLRFTFSGGDSGTLIEDGGSDMYDGGNILGTNVAGSIPYSDNVVVPSGAFGPNGRYFTRKFPGLFVLVADLDAIGSFTISGNLGADGNGSIDAAVLQTQRSGVNYRGFVKRVFGADEPSVNHLIIVADPVASHSFLPDTNDDRHVVHISSTPRRLFYLLYAGRNGSYIDNPTSLAIMNAFLNALEGPASWLTASPSSGAVPAGGSLDVTVTLDAALLTLGDFDAEVLVASNDPDEPEVVVPAHLHVTGSPEIELTPTELDFGELLVGVSRSLTLTVTNDGTDVLTASLGTDHADFTVVPASLSLPLGGSQTVTVTFRPAAHGAVEAGLSVSSNDLGQGDLTVPLRGAGVMAPEIGVSPLSIEASAALGDLAARGLVVRNTGGSNLFFEAAFDTGSPGLEEVLASVTANVDTILSAIPGRFNFVGGESGDAIADGGSDMYDGGNVLGTDLGGSIPYSNNSVIESDEFGPGGRYFTRKYPGLFVLAADLDDVDSFSVGGNLGADGLGKVSGAELVTQVAGRRYRGFVKRVHDASNPSVDHLIILPDTPGLGHDFASSTDSDQHRVFGLSGSKRLYYLLFAGTLGRFASDEATLTIMRRFLEAFGQYPWITIEPASGAVAPGEQSQLTAYLDGAGVDVGAHAANIRIFSNDLDAPAVQIPVAFTVLLDEDRDGRSDAVDNCPLTFNPLQEDGDEDGVGSICDNCPSADNPTQVDGDNDTLGDLCDNCPAVFNVDQQDLDGDLLGDPCDNCSTVSNPEQEDDNLDGFGNACQPSLALHEIHQDGGANLEVRAEVRDPQDDPLQGSIEVAGGQISILQDMGYTGDCGLGFLPDGEPGRGIGFVNGSAGEPYLFDLDSVFGCDDRRLDFIIAAGPCEQPTTPFTTLLPLSQTQDRICLLRFQASGPQEPGRTFRLLDYTLESATLSGDSTILMVDFTGRPPREVDLTNLEFGQIYSLAMSVSDGSTAPVSAAASFLYQGEQRLVFNTPPTAVAQAPSSAECEGSAGTLVTLDGTASRDPDAELYGQDELALFEWLEDPGLPSERTLGIGPTLTTALTVGLHSIGLRVTDIVGESSTSSLQINIQDSRPPQLTCPAPVMAECAGPDGVALALVATAVDLCDPTPSMSNDRTGGGGDASGLFPLGETAVGFTARDASGNMAQCSTGATVRDTAAPALVASAVPSMLWPPNHSMVPVQVTWQASDVCDAGPSVQLVSVTSNEPADAPGGADGQTAVDISGAELGTADGEILLRAERAAGGTGRIYQLTYRALDASGNGTIRVVTVSVPRGGAPDPMQLKIELMSVEGKAKLDWQPIPWALSYDVISGDLSSARVVGDDLLLGSVRVLARGTDKVSVHEVQPPPVPELGRAFFYLAQPRTALGGTGYGTAWAPWPRLPESCEGGCP